MSKPSWKIYEEELHKRGHGLPLWVPEPSDGNEVQIGDVGIIYDGQFKPMFNAVSGDTYGGWRLPEGFEHISIPNQLQSTVQRWFSAGQYVVSAGTTVKKGGANAEALNFGQISLQLQATSKKAAFLVVREDALRQTVIPNRGMSDYMTKNLDYWFALASGVGLPVKPDDIIFIRGHIKTSAWGVAAVSHTSSHLDVAVSGGYGPASAGLSYSIDETQNPYFEHRDWPKAGMENHTTLPSDQCLFLSYYKLKRRFVFPSKIVAGAEPDTLPDDSPEDPSTGQDTRSGISPGNPPIEQVIVPDSYQEHPSIPDPVDQLLDWILKQTEDKGVEEAIACDGDLTELFRGREWADDIPAFLDALNPDLSIEGKVAMISQEHAIYRAHFPPEEDAAEAYALAYPEDIQDDNNGEGPSDSAGADTEEVGEASGSHGEQTVAVAEPATGSGAEGDQVGEVGEGGEGVGGGEGVESGEDSDRDAEEPPLPPRPVKRRPMNSTSVIGKCVMGDRTMEWPHRQLLDRDDNSESAAIASFHVSPNGEYVGVGYEDGQVRIWSDEKWQLVVRIEEKHASSVTSLKFSPDGTRVVSADSVAIVWDIEDSAHGHYHQISRLLGQDEDDLIWDMAWSPDGKTIATGASDATIRLYAADTGRLTRTLDELPTLVSHVEFSKDGQYLVGIADAVGYIWQCSTASMVGRMDGHAANIWAMSFSDDCKRIVTGSEDNTSRIWNTENGEELVTLREHTGPVWAVGFSPDGKNVMAGSYDATISICDSFLGDRIHLLQGGQSVVTSAAYSPGGHYITSGSADGTVKLWDTATGNLHCELSGHEDHIKTTCFSPKDNAIISSSDDGTVRVWSLTDILRL